MNTNLHNLLDMVNVRSEKVLYVLSAEPYKCVIHAVNRTTYKKAEIFNGSDNIGEVFLSGVLWGLGKG